MPAEVLIVLTKSDRVSGYPFRRQTMESNSLRLGFHFKDESFLPACKQPSSCAVRRYESKSRRGQKSLCTYKAFIRNIPQTKLLPVFKKGPTCTCVCTGTWVATSNRCVTKVNMRNVFYYNIYEYAHCPQQLRLTYSV